MPTATKSIDVYVSYNCNEKCIFCLTSFTMKGLKENPFPADKLKRFLYYMRTKGYNNLNFTGGEPVLYGKLRDILQSSKELGYKIQLSTNGCFFAKEDVCEDILPYVDYVCLAVHGHNASLHELHTQTEKSFENLQKAICNFRNYAGISFNTNTVLTRFNLSYLLHIVRFILNSNLFSHIVLSNTCPVGDASRNYKDISFKMSEFVQRVPDIEKLMANTTVKLTLFGFPLCVLKQYRKYSNDIYYEKYRLSVFNSKDNGKFTLVPDVQKRIFTKDTSCKTCLYDSLCQGIFKLYFETYGGSEVQPFIHD